MRLLALDCATKIGWALFERPAGPVRFETWRAPVDLAIADYGVTFVALEAWLNDTVAVFRPQVISFEAPVVPFQGLRRSSRDILRLLIGMATIVELVARRARLRCIEVSVFDAKQRLTGNGRATKREMITAAVNLGHLVATDHEADAIAVGLAAYDHIAAAGRR
jgi:Holliday junction resolvasome RuvABC endonuclease subunit